jgi:hypothetical protein
MTALSITDRTLHLVDLENLLGEHRKEADANAGLREYLHVARWSQGDHVDIAADPEIIRQIGFDKPVPCALHAARGNDAADEMLLAMAPPELIARRYRRLVIGSGDVIFLKRALAARELGVGVVIVARSNGVAARYRRRAFPVVEFEFDNSGPVGERCIRTEAA